MWVPILLAAALICWLPFYIWTDYRWDHKRYLWTKLIASLLFLSVAVSAFLILHTNADYAIWVIVALCLGLIGDVLLVFADNLKFFILGLVSFLLGQVCYAIVFARFVGFSWIDAVVYAVVIGATLIAYSRAKLDLGKMKIPVLVYVLVIAFMFVMAVSTIYKSGFSSAAVGLIVAGAALFAMSDIVLAFVRFGRSPHRSLRAVNLSTYYFAQILLALSVTAVV